MSLEQKILAIHRSLDAATIPHAFGGALALAWCTERARGTIDIDVNVFSGVDDAPRTLAALPHEVSWSDDDVERLVRDGQIRLWWDETPVDLFMSTTEFHDEAGSRSRREPFGGADVPFLDCTDLAVFKAFFDRTRDWADLEDMKAAGTLDVDRTIGVLVRYLGTDDARIQRLHSLADATPPASDGQRP